VYAWVEDERGALKRMKPWRNAKQQNFLPHSIEEEEKEKKKRLWLIQLLPFSIVNSKNKLKFN
jgi:hypothetical protein